MLAGSRDDHLTQVPSAPLGSALTFILAFGAVRAVTNFFAGALSDRFGRKPVLVGGWLAACMRPGRGTNARAPGD